MNKPTFRKTNLSWIVDYDYERSNCTCHDWPCRCTRIENTHIDNVNVREVVKELYCRHSRTGSYFDKYCFDRACYTFDVYDKDLYEVEVCGGYYGEEVYGVWFDNEEKVLSAYDVILSFDTNLDKIKYCLKSEYGYLLECVQNASSAYIAEVHINDIITPQMEYFKKCDKKVIEEYKDIDLPIAVCVRDSDKFRLIDGYHRFVANKDREKVEIIVLE